MYEIFGKTSHDFSGAIPANFSTTSNLGLISLITTFFASANLTNAGLSSNEILRINEERYTKEEFINFVKYRLYKSNGEMSVDEEKYANDIENGVAKESLYLSDSLNEFYKFFFCLIIH